MAQNKSNKREILPKVPKELPSNAIFAESKKYAISIKNFNLQEWKALAFVLSHINFKETLKTDGYSIPKKELAEFIGVASDSKHVSHNLKRALSHMVSHSAIKFESDDGRWRERILINEIDATDKDIVKFYFNERALPYFGNLGNGDFIIMLTSDYKTMTSIRSIQMYEYLRTHMGNLTSENNHSFGIKELKEIFNIPKNGEGSYLDKNGHFQRTRFEQRILNTITFDLDKCRMIKLIHFPIETDDGTIYVPYKKIKENGTIKYYFEWIYRNPEDLDKYNEVLIKKEEPKRLEEIKEDNQKDIFGDDDPEYWMDTMLPEDMFS